MFKHCLKDIIDTEENKVKKSKTQEDDTKKDSKEKGKLTDKSLSSVIRNNIRSHIDIKNQDSNEFKELVSKLQVNYHELLDSVCTKLNKKLRLSRAQSFLSGSTGVLLMVHSGKIISANVGDSRAILILRGRNEKEGVRFVELTRDLVPLLVEEKRRILKSGGEIKRVLGKKLIQKKFLKFFLKNIFHLKFF